MEETKTRKLSTYVLIVITTASVLVACAASVGLAIVLWPKDVGNGTPTAQGSGTQVITASGVLTRIESTSVLQTTVFRIDTVVRAKKENKIWFITVGGQNLLLFVQGSVTAGVDLGELDADNIQVSQTSKTIMITLPPAKILGAELDDYQIENYAGEPPKRVNTELIQEALEAGREQIATTACESGILQYATTDAERAFEQIVAFADFTGYEVVIKTTPAMDCSIEVKVKQ